MLITIKPLTSDHLNAVKDIYNHYIATTHINFEVNPYDDEYMQNWFTQFNNQGPYQAYIAQEAEGEGKILGFILSQKFRDKPAYSTSVETTVYLASNAAGKGLGKKLGQFLLKRLKQQDVNRAYAIIALPNLASLGMHKSLGYQQAAHFSQVGRKFGKFHDVVYLEYQF